MKRFSRWILPLLGLGCLFLIGCGGASGPAVTGKLTLDGAPLANAEVVLEPFDRTQKLGSDTVFTDATGAFKVTPHPKKKSLVPGKFAFYVSKWVRKDGSSPPEGEMEMEKASNALRNAVPDRYSNRETGALISAEIKNGSNDIGTHDIKSK